MNHGPLLSRRNRFLLTQLHVDSLCDQTTKKKVLTRVKSLRKGSEALNQAYKDALSRIDAQLAGHRDLAKRALSWITYAQRPLSTKELCLALAIEPGECALDHDNIDKVEDVISVCAGLVTVDEESSIIRLVHYTAQEYFELACLGWNPGAQEEIAVACLTYLSFDTFRSGSCDEDEAFEQRLTENPFFDYTAHHWSEHVRPVQSITSSLALAFLCDEVLVDCAAQGALTPKYKFEGYSRNFPKRTSGLHLTAMYGLLSLTEKLLVDSHGDTGIRADSKDDYGWTPLSRAAGNGHEAVVRLLLDIGKVEADSKDNDGWTPLWRAAENGHEAVVRLLLDTGKVEADSKDNYGQTPLLCAAGSGHEAVVRLLLDTGKVEADSKDILDRKSVV